MISAASIMTFALSAGITCRWASKHEQPDALTREHLIAPHTTAAAESTGANAAVADSTAQPAVITVGSATSAGPQPAEDATWAAGSGAPLHRSTETAAAAASSSDGAAAAAAADAAAAPLLDAAVVPSELPQQQQRHTVAASESSGPAQGPHDSATAAASDAAWLNGVGGGSGASGGAAAAPDAVGAAGSRQKAAGSGIEELPVAAALPACTNFLEKGVQIQLR